MLHIRFTSYVLGLLFVLYVLNDSSVYAHQGRKEPLVTRKDASEDKEDLNGIVTASTTIIGLGRGKMVEYKERRKENEEARKGKNGATSEISGENRNASSDSLGTSQENLTSQQDIKVVLQTNNLETVSLTTPRNEAKILLNSNPKHSQDSKAEPLTQESFESSEVSEKNLDDDISEKDEARILLEAAKEIVNLMHKDYKGMGHRKPPINNHEPWH